MADTTKIEWTDSTFNPWVGCQHVSPGCNNCYAEAMMDKRYGKVKWGPKAVRVRTSPSNWRKPLAWNADGKRFERENKRRRRVFCASLADVFDNRADPAWRADLFALIRNTAQLDWLLLTKRPQNIAKMLPGDWGRGYPNVWLGITAEDAEHYRQRWPILGGIPAVVRFISYEPAIGPLGGLDLGDGMTPHWLICGGESGSSARTMQPQWARAALKEARLHGVAFFMKQWGTYQSNPLVCERGLASAIARSSDAFGKGGKLLDGAVYHEFPRSDRRAESGCGCRSII
jgi:protein gp37